MDVPAHSIFSGPIMSIFNSMRFDGDPVTGQCEKEDKKAEGFQISHCDGSFSSDTMAVKGLMYNCMYIPGDSQSVQLGYATRANERGGRERRLPVRLGNKNCQNGHTHATLSLYEIHL